MNRIVVHIAAVILGVCCAVHADETSHRDLYADTWVATDAGQNHAGLMMRRGEDGSAAGNGNFYITWHSDLLGTKKPVYGGCQKF